MLIQKYLQIATKGKEVINITDEITQQVDNANQATGLCHIFLHHTSASIILCENADPLVREDLETFFAKLIPDGDPIFKHTIEGPDDMPAHIRTVLTGSFLMIPITKHRLALGTWQGIYLWEHRIEPQQRKLTVTIF